MFDINLIRKDITVTKEKMLNKKVPSNLFDQIFDLDVLVRNLMQQEQNLNAKKNQLSKEIAILAKNKYFDQHYLLVYALVLNHILCFV